MVSETEKKHLKTAEKFILKQKSIYSIKKHDTFPFWDTKGIQQT